MLTTSFKGIKEILTFIAKCNDSFAIIYSEAVPWHVIED